MIASARMGRKKEPKKTGGSEKDSAGPTREDSNYRLYKDTMKDVVTIAQRREMTVADLLDPLLKAFVKAELAVEIERMQKQIK